jgi:hypothetical protein
MDIFYVIRDVGRTEDYIVEEERIKISARLREAAIMS